MLEKFGEDQLDRSYGK